jgi:hypothetical protein
MKENRVSPNTRPGEVDPVKGISMDPDVFFEQVARREKLARMQETVRPGRTTPVAIRFDRFTLTRLKALAATRNTGYQTLLKEFVVERLYEEERREGIIDALPRDQGDPGAAQRPARQRWRPAAAP